MLRFTPKIVTKWKSPRSCYYHIKKNGFVTIFMSRGHSGMLLCRLSSLGSIQWYVLLFGLMMTYRQMGSRMKKSVVLVEVAGIMGGCDSVGEECVSWWLLRMCSRHFFFVFPSVTLEGFESFSGGRFAFGKFCFLHSTWWCSCVLISQVLFLFLRLTFLCGLHFPRCVIFGPVLGRRLSFCSCSRRRWSCLWGGVVVYYKSKARAKESRGTTDLGYVVFFLVKGGGLRVPLCLSWFLHYLGLPLWRERHMGYLYYSLRITGCTWCILLSRFTKSFRVYVLCSICALISRCEEGIRCVSIHILWWRRACVRHTLSRTVPASSCPSLKGFVTIFVFILF
jgi:hypothetical protein